jgi:hypothetical protein
MDEAQIRTTEEEALLLAEFLRTQEQAIAELARDVERACADAREARGRSRRIKAEIAARRARFDRPWPQ